MTTHERFQALMHFQPVDRLPLVEWAGWWDKTIERWRSEGLPADLNDRYDICRHFGLDVYVQCGLPTRGPDCPQAPGHGLGIVANMDDYEKIRPHLFPEPKADPTYWGRLAEEQRRGDIVIWFTFEGFFWFPRTLLGIEPHLYAFYDQPELMHRINSDLAEWQLKALDAICSVCSPDFMTFAEDMSYNHGPMLSKELFDEFLLPYYRKVTPPIRERGVLSIIDSDGDITVPAGWFEEAGLDGILPLERQAGVDVVGIRKVHPRMLFIGCYDKMVMNKGEAAMRTEFERLMPAAKQGGLIISCDHQTPPGVSYSDYKLYVRLFREYAEQL